MSVLEKSSYNVVKGTRVSSPIDFRPDRIDMIVLYGCSFRLDVFCPGSPPIRFRRHQPVVTVFGLMPSCVGRWTQSGSRRPYWPCATRGIFRRMGFRRSWANKTEHHQALDVDGAVGRILKPKSPSHRQRRPCRFHLPKECGTVLISVNRTPV